MIFTKLEVFKMKNLVTKEIDRLKELSDDLKNDERLKDDPLLPKLIKEHKKILEKLDVLFEQTELYEDEEYQD